MTLTNPTWLFPALPLEMPLGLVHLDSDLCWSPDSSFPKVQGISKSFQEGISFLWLTIRRRRSRFIPAAELTPSTELPTLNTWTSPAMKSPPVSWGRTSDLL